jgi:CHAT domain-containing protein
MAAEDAAANDPAQRALHLVDVAYAALLAGEPRRAQRVLDDIQSLPEGPTMARHLAALRLWASQLDRNWYPGNLGAEAPHVTGDLNLAPSPGPDETVFVEHIITRGPVALLTPRAIIAGQLGRGNREAAAQMADSAIGTLQALITYANQIGAPAVALWGWLAQADLARRTGRPELAGQWLAAIRAHAAELGLPNLLALSHLIEGDWWATPGSSPEALGFDLASTPTPSPRATSDDLDRAERCFSTAEQLVTAGAAAVTAPALWVALQLRWATLAWLREDHPRRRLHLDIAIGAVADTADGATGRLLAIHLLVADLAEGRLGERLLEIGSGWGPPATGSVAETRRWAEVDGSTSWCAGLGRLLQRAGDLWKDQREDDRASLAYLGALHLLGADPGVPSRTLATAVADLDTRRNLTSRALARLERLLRTVPAVSDVREQMFDLGQELEILVAIVNAQRSRQRTAAAEHAARALERVQTRLRFVLDLAHSSALSPETPGTFAAAMAKLQQLLEAEKGKDLQTLVDSVGDDGPLLAMLALLLGQAKEQLELVEVLVSMSRGEHAQRRGLTAQADRWFDVALEAAQGAAPFLVPLVLIAADRREEARTHIATIAETGSLDDDLLVLLALRANDPATATAAFSRTGADPTATADWRIALTGAELAVDDPPRALALASHGITLHEEAVSRLLRDTDRVAACDDPDATSLYLTAAKASLRLADDDPGNREDHLARAFGLAERARSLAIDHVLRDDLADEASIAGRAWRQAAATWAAAVDRLLAGIDASPPIDTTALLDEADAAEAALRDIEAQLDQAAPGSLARRSQPSPPLQLASVQERLPPGALLLEYHTVGDDLLVCAVTSDRAQVEQRPVRSRHLSAIVQAYHRRCADGWGAGPEADELASLLLEPVADAVRAHYRVLIAPFGPLNLVPLHALPFDSAPLGLTHVVSYGPAAAVAVPNGLDLPIPLDRVAIVGDPAFEGSLHPRLRRLPGARTEAKVIAAELRTTDVLVDVDATEREVRGLIQGRNVVHLATHGWLDELAPYASSLVLAGRDELTVAELVGLRVGADLAVLSACDTGRGAATLGGDVVGLTRALLAAGVPRMVVSLWPVDDVTACVTMATFYEHLASEMPAAPALAQAQAFVHGLDHAALRGQYATLCHQADTDGDTDSQDRRRGQLELPAELRDDEELPPPLGGAAERHWAPFIVVGA